MQSNTARSRKLSAIEISFETQCGGSIDHRYPEARQLQRPPLLLLCPSFIRSSVTSAGQLRIIRPGGQRILERRCSRSDRRGRARRSRSPAELPQWDAVDCPVEWFRWILFCCGSQWRLRPENRETWLLEVRAKGNPS